LVSAAEVPRRRNYWLYSMEHLTDASLDSQWHVPTKDRVGVCSQSEKDVFDIASQSESAVDPFIMADPFALFSLNSEHEEQYLSDAKVRLANSEMWNVNATAELRKLIQNYRRCPQVAASLDNLTIQLQHNVAEQLIPFRSLLWDMARTLWETLSHHRSGDEELMKECSEQLEAIIRQMAEAFEQQNTALTHISNQHHMAIVEHVANCDAAAEEATDLSLRAFLCSIVGCLGLGALVLGVLKPSAVVSAGLAHQAAVLARTEKERAPSDYQDAVRVRKGRYQVGTGVYRFDWKSDKVTLLDDYKETKHFVPSSRLTLKKKWRSSCW